MTTYTNIPQDITKLKDEKMDKSNNLSDLADRAAAWLNVRPIGSTPLAGDPVGDYDAVTKRWVENRINTGTVGPTMNGVMNYGVGDFHLRDSRAYIQPYEVVSDGQLLNRADWPELWAYAQMVGVIEDSVWLADKFQRGKYSNGDGATTFRVPDKNGVQAGSIRALYGRGDGGNSGANGQLFESAAPNITGYFTSYSGGSYAQAIGSSYGAFYSNNGVFPDGTGDAIPGGATALAGRYNTCNFDASRSSPIYGASTDEILTRNFVGVWVIRASGGFVAANTSWSVINGDTSVPAPNTVVYGGQVSSEYRVNGALRVSSSIMTRYTENGEIIPIIRVTDNRTGTSSSYDRPIRDAYQVTNLGTGGHSINIIKNNTRGWQIISRRFPVTCPPNSATNWNWNFVAEGATPFVNYPGISANGQAGNSADWLVQVEGITPSQCAGFIHNKSSTTLVVWVMLIAHGTIASTWEG